MTSAELANILGVSGVIVYFWETAGSGRSPSPKHLVRLATVLRCATTDLAPLADPPTLADHRAHAGLTAAEVAAALGMSRPSFSEIERHSRRWPAEHADRWAQIIGITTRQFRAAWDVHAPAGSSTRPDDSV